MCAATRSAPRCDTIMAVSFIDCEISGLCRRSPAPRPPFCLPSPHPLPTPLFMAVNVRQRKKTKLIPSLNPERQSQDEKPGKKLKIADKDERKKFFAARARAETDKGEGGSGIAQDRMSVYRGIKKEGRKDAKRRRKQMAGNDDE